MPLADLWSLFVLHYKAREDSELLAREFTRRASFRW